MASGYGAKNIVSFIRFLYQINVIDVGAFDLVESMESVSEYKKYLIDKLL